MAQSAPELVIQRADSGLCEHAAFSHDGQLLATDNGDEVLLWEVSTGKLLSTTKSYYSPEINHKDKGGTVMGAARAKGTVVFSPDDKIVAVLPVDFANPMNFGPPGGPSSLWNVDTGLPLTTGQWNLDDHIARNNAAPSTTEVETWTISGNRARVTELLEKGMKLYAISGDGSIGASRSEEPRNDQHIQLIDLKTGQVLRTLDASFNDVLGMALSYDGRYFAVHSSNRRFVTIWDTASGAELTQIKQDVQYPSVGHIAFSPNGKWFAVEWGEIVLFETATWKRTSSFSKEIRSTVEGELTFSPDSKKLAIAGGTVSLIDVPTGKLLQTACTSPLHGMTAVQWNEKTGVFALASDKFARIWVPAPAAQPATLVTKGTIHALALSNDGRIAVGTRDDDRDVKGNVYYEGTTKLWYPNAPDKETDLEVANLPALSGTSSISLDFAPDGKAVAAAMLDELQCPPKNREAACDRGDISLVGLFTVWNAASGNLLRKRRQPDPELNVVAFSPDGSQIATAHQNKIVKIYDTASLNRTRAFKAPENETYPTVSDYGTSALAYSPDGKFLLAGSRNGLVWLLDAVGENPPRILRKVEPFDPTRPNEEYSSAIVAVLFSHDGKRADAVESAGVVRKWSTTDWSDAGHYQIPAGVSAAALSPNNQVIASALTDGTVRFYAAETGQLKLVLASTADPNSGLVIATDGQYDFGIPDDSSLAAYRVGRKTVTVDNLPGNRRTPGLLAGFLKENSEIHAESPSRTHGQE